MMIRSASPELPSIFSANHGEAATMISVPTTVMIMVMISPVPRAFRLVPACDDSPESSSTSSSPADPKTQRKVPWSVPTL